MFDRIKKLFSAKDEADEEAQVIVHQEQHGINKRLISPNALKVINRLQDNGYSAFIVGGGIRDILLDTNPKDFDVATDATPEQVKRLFSNAMIIGRRFRIVHVRFGREIIEVTTFRDHHEQANNRREADRSHKGMLLRDNVYGDIRSDALRRDFTVNALYYNPSNGELLDYADGLADLEDRELHIIGDAEARYREDPVRMLRAIRFAAKLGFKIYPATARPIPQLAPLLRDVSTARMFDEILKLMMSGSATATLALLREHQLFEHLFPGTHDCVKKDDFAERLVSQAIINTDKRIRQGKRVTPAFIFAVFLWPGLQKAMEDLGKQQKISTQDAMQRCASGVIGQQLTCSAIPKRFLIPMREIWSLQLRLPRRDGQRAFAMLEHPRFRAAYDFLLLREEAGEKLDGLGQWWTRFQDADEDTQQKMVQEIKGPGRKRRPRRRRSGGQPPKNGQE